MNLSELIKACGKDFRWLKHKGTGGNEHWLAQQSMHGKGNDLTATGETPEEAVEKLLAKIV